MTYARSLACWTGIAGAPRETVRQLQQLTEATTQWRGSQDEYTLGLRWRTANWIAETGANAEAVRQLEKALADAALILGADHEVTKAAQKHLQLWRDQRDNRPTLPETTANKA